MTYERDEEHENRATTAAEGGEQSGFLLLCIRAHGVYPCLNRPSPLRLT